MLHITALQHQRVEIIPATLRDVSFVAANMCEGDWQEIECQFPPGTVRADLVPLCFVGGEAWVAAVDGQPVEVFGALPATVSVLTVWAFGTDRHRRAIPEITRFIRWMVPQWIARGVTRAEARSIVGHDAAHRWLRGLGGTETPCPMWGRDGQDFTLFSWTRDTWANAES